MQCVDLDFQDMIRPTRFSHNHDPLAGLHAFQWLNMETSCSTTVEIDTKRQANLPESCDYDRVMNHQTNHVYKHDSPGIIRPLWVDHNYAILARFRVCY